MNEYKTVATTQGYHFYWSGPFSQWQACQISLWGVQFNTAEQAMMYGKAQVFDDAVTGAEILAASDPGKQKALGRKVAGFTEEKWDEVKCDLVREINFAKFDQNKGLRRKLFQTAPKLLVEASPIDTIWAIGLDAETASITPEEDWPGQNLLGRILTDVREALTARYPEEAKACRAGV
ncbi:MAG: NADAR family protein [Pseudomonadota bacterium]